jgi:AraC family transcriptional regulator, regulatory protein of adaptative response / methylated-DNA-[protein]-cysteine methyltransferase
LLAFVTSIKLTEMTHYQTIARAIDYIVAHTHEHVSLEDIAKQCGLSPSYTQKVFSEWAGISPKQLQQFLSLAHAKKLLSEGKSSLKTTHTLALSSGSRLHDMFVTIEAMTPGEFKNGGEPLTISYSTHASQFGDYIVASTSKGICNVLFLSENGNAEDSLRHYWPSAALKHEEAHIHVPVIRFFEGQISDKKIKLHLNGTNYQIQVWRALLNIPSTSVTSYGRIAKEIGRPNDSRVVGRAIGQNPVSYIIPCHRVLKSSGDISGYYWGVTKKRAMLAYEAAQTTSKI